LGRPQHPPVQAATGLTRLGARDHDPALGVFTTPDPITAFGDPAALDPYTYARWNPLTNSDPTGLWPNWGKVVGGLRNAAYQLVVADVAGCLRGSGSACAWAAVGFIPGAGKAAKGIALAAKGLLRRAGSGLTDGIASANATESTAGATRHTPPPHPATTRNTTDPPTRTPTTSAANPPTTATAANAGVRALPSLPKALSGGPANVHVYYGVRDGQNVYVGITNNIGRRTTQHADRFVPRPITTDPLTRGQARAVEEALTLRNPGFENKIHSISPTHSYYDDAVSWGQAWLRQNGL
jgi:RHS repeat-associated protein